MTVIIPERLIGLLQEARHVVVFTGAGVSAESGIPTFRDALTGHWERFNAERLATPEGFREDPHFVWGWYESRRAGAMRASPNDAHRAIAEMERKVEKLTVITQNVDDLHERAGSTAPTHLHGSLFTPRCATCSHPAQLAPDIPAEPDGGRLPPPRCNVCGSWVRPGVVWFGEGLPEAALAQAFEAARACDVLLSVGTSGSVYPAAAIPFEAVAAGATVVQVNPQATGLDRVAQFSLRGPAAVVLPQLVHSAW